MNNEYNKYETKMNNKYERFQLISGFVPDRKAKK